MTHLQDRCPVKSWEEVKKELELEYASDLDLKFALIEETPIGDGSLHKCTGRHAPMYRFDLQLKHQASHHLKE